MDEEDPHMRLEDLSTEADGNDVSLFDVDGQDFGTDDDGIGGEESVKVMSMVSFDVKMRELLRNICSIEVAVYSKASKEFVRLLGGDSGGELFCEYVRASPSCMELLEAWKLRQGKPGMAYILSLISVILEHPDGKYHVGDLERLTISRRLDKFARSIVETKMEDVYVELNSGEVKRQNAALLLMAAVVRRGIGLASEVAKVFDFKLPVFPKLAEVQLKKGGKRVKHSTRAAFTVFAMSFLEVGNPRLLRWILQQKDMYYGVLRRLSGDDENTIVHVLTKLRDNVLRRESLVPVGLRSVLFGSVTLEQLSTISGIPNGGPAADMAHEVLVMACTDPCNGLMPDLKLCENPLKGNPKRLLGLMKKLKATETEHHRALLLAIVHGRPLLGSAYMDEFPYVLEPRASHLWFAAISLAADLISSSVSGLSFTSFSSQFCDPPTLDCLEIQCILKCIIPHSVTRLVINRGLLHSDILVKHGSLRLLFEALKALDSFIGAINVSLENMHERELTVAMHPSQSKIKGLLGNSDLGNVNMDSTPAGIGETFPYSSAGQKWLSLRREIQNEVRAMLPDPQVLLKLLSSFNYGFSEMLEPSLKRGRGSEPFPKVNRMKKTKSNPSDENIDIIIGGVSAENGTEKTMGCCDDVKGNLATKEAAEAEKDDVSLAAEIWGLHELSVIGNGLKQAETFFYSKLLDALTLYLRTLPFGMEGSFDFFKILPSNPLLLPVSIQQSSLSLLIEYVGQSPGRSVSSRGPEQLFKHLQPLINLLIFSPLKSIKDNACILAHAAMLSTGAFDRNLVEIDSWFLFLPGYDRNKCSLENQVHEAFQDLSGAVISFFCDAVSVVGNNLYKYLDHARALVSKLEVAKDFSLNFSPLITCILQKCLRLLELNSGTTRLQDRTMISMYVCNTLSFILQTQVEVGSLPFLLDLILKEKFEDLNFLNDESRISHCEWRPLKNLHLFVQSVLPQKACYRTYSISEVSATGDKHSISEILAEVKKIKRSGLIDGINKVATAFCSAIVCADPGDLLESFPSLICVTCQLLREDISFLTSIFFCERKLLSTVATFWPDMFFSGLELVGSTIFGSYQENNGCSLNIDFDSIDSSVAFSLFLEHIPFHVLFSALSAFGHSDLLCSTKILDLLRAKLSKCSVDGCISLLRLMLFWMHQIRLSYTAKPSAEMEQLLESFSILIEHMLESLFVVSSGSSKTDGQSSTIACMQQLADSIFRHPVVTASLSDPFACDRKSMDENFGDSLEAFLSLSKHCIHPIDGCILRLVNHVMDYVLSVINSCKSTVYDAVYGPSLNSFKLLIQQAVLTFKEKIDQYVISGDLIPLLQSFYVFHSFMGFISPYELMELAYWIFCKVDQNDSVGCKSSGLSVLSVGIFIAQGAFDMLASHLHQQDMTKVSCSLLWRMEYNSFNFSLLKQVYYRIMTYATTFSLACADLCLLKAWNSFCHTKLLPPETSVLPLGMVMERLVISSPIEVLVHFIHKTSMTKAKALLRLTEASPLYLSLFGHVFLYILNKVSPDVDATDANSTFSPVRDMLLEKSGCSLSDEDFLLLLPSALSFLTSISVRSVKAEVKDLRRIPSFYSRILFDCFSRWSSAFGNIFQEEYSEYMPKSLEEFLRICSSSFLGKAMQMLQCYFYLNENSISNKKRVKLFNSIYPRSSVHNELLNCDLCELDVHSSKQLLNFTHGVVAKISLSRMLLFPQDRLFKFSSLAVDKMKETPLEVGSDDRLEHAKLRFMNIIVGALDKIVKTFAVSDSQNYNGSNCSQILRYLEVFILENVVQISMNMRSELTQMHEIPFLKPFIQSSLLHRFEDPSTLRALHNILLSLNRGRFSSGEVFELLLAHSQFVPTILWNESTSDSSGLSQSGPLSRPISSMLKMLNVPSTDKTVSHAKGCREISSEKPSLCERKLEVIKLLRVLYSLKSKQFVTNPGKEASMNSRELLSLLLSGYGATLNETDLEIFHLMHEIESTEGSDCGSIAEMDYLWGSSVLRLRREQALERFLSSSNTADCETTEEWRRRQYRENIPVDPKICVMTVLHFCYDRVAWTGPMPLDVEKLQQFDFVHSSKLTPASMGEVQRYDPAFLLCFSIHGLSMGYIKPLEFAGLGLLAVAFVSLSSPDEGIRKLGYEVLGRFKKSLESYQSSKDVLRFRLLLTYLQNGIVEPWQKIPSPTAIFVAEASFILLDPAHDHYFTTSNFLVRCPQVDLKAIPLFHTLFGSSSVHFKTDHLWILRLSYASLKLDDDAQILMKKCIIEQLLSFYVSSLSDHESKLLILQIVKKAMEFHRLAHYLVERCGLISWLSSILPLSMELFGEHRDLYLSQMSMVLKVVHVIISSNMLAEWLQKYGLEQLSELSSHLYMLFIGGLESLKKNIELVDSILGVLVSTLRISQKRKLYQPHFTLALDGLYAVFEALDDLSDSELVITAELGLKTMLMSMPLPSMFVMDTEKLSKFLMWVVATALWSTRCKECHTYLTLAEEQSEEVPISKLLRWLTASLLLWKISGKCRKTCISFRTGTLQSLFESIDPELEENISNCEVVAATLLYLQQLTGTNSEVLPSVVAALCLLLCSNAKRSTVLLNDEDIGHITLLCSKIRFPVEANPAWRWSYYQPWKDLSWEQTDAQRIEEQQACQTVLLMFSNALNGKSFGLPVLTHHDLERSQLFLWERNIFVANE